MLAWNVLRHLAGNQVSTTIWSDMRAERTDSESGPAGAMDRNRQWHARACPSRYRRGLSRGGNGFWLHTLFARQTRRLFLQPRAR